MSLHARNIAIAAGAPSHAIEECVIFMTQTDRINNAAAVEYLAAHKLQIHLNPTNSNDSISVRPSMFYFQLPSEKADTLSLNISFATLGLAPVTLLFISDNLNDDPLMQDLFGINTYSWVVSVLNLLDQIELSTVRPTRAKASQSKKLKLISILMNIITRRLLVRYPDIIETFVRDNFSSPYLENKSPSCVLTFLEEEPKDFLDNTLRVGLSFLLALWQVFEFRVGNYQF